MRLNLNSPRHTSFRDESGQAVILLVLAMGIFLLGALGLALDGSHLFAQRQMAQSAADAAAQAGIMSIFDGTASFSTSGSFACTSTDTRTPCAYAISNGFNTTADTVVIDYPADSAAPGVNFSADPVHLIRANVSRTVKTTLMQFLGSTATTVTASAMAAIVSTQSPVPILITHPTLSSSFALQGHPAITICGGPSRSIQVNSGSSSAASLGGSSSVDLSHAGPLDPGDCSAGTGADFGVWGGPSTSPGGISYGTKPGKYISNASPVLDPLANVAAPPVPTNTGAMGTKTSLKNGSNGCTDSSGCMLYHPGLWTGGIDAKLSTAVFAPGIYYLDGGGFTCSANCNIYMATGLTDSGTGTTNTGWTGNVLFYNTGTSKTAAPINLSANGNIFLTGSPASSAYDGILFFQDHTSPALTHSLGGNGALQLVGTIYLTNTLATMTSTPKQYQSLALSGTSGSGTDIQGEIIVGALSMGGNGGITMNLNALSYPVRQIALVQ